MSLRVLFFSVVAFGLSLLFASTALAQRNVNPAMQHMQTVKTGGTLVSVSQNQIQLSTNTNQKIFVMVPPDAEVSVTGTAEQDYLKSGVTVEFVAEIDKTHTCKDKLVKLLIVTPTTERPAGLFAPEFATPDKKGEKGDGEAARPLARDPGIGGDAPAKGRKPHGKKEPDLFANDPLSSKPSKGRSSAPQLPGTFTVRGTIKMCKDGKITVAAGKGPTIKAELKDDVTIGVDMADIRVAQPEDRVTVNGYTNQARPNMVMAKSITIDLANPLSGAKKHASHAKTPAAHAPKSKKGAGDGNDLLGTEK